MLCGEQTLLGEAYGHGIAASLRCKRWSCPDCRPVAQAMLRRLVREVEPTHHLVLTSNPHWLDSADDRARRLAKAWALCRRRLRRRFGARFDFVAVFEATKRSEPHIHLAVADRPVSANTLKRLLSKWMGDLTSAPNVTVQHVRDFRGGIAGLARYLAKGPRLFAGGRRFWTSRGWRTRLAEAAFVLLAIARGPLLEIAREAVANGHIIIRRSPLCFVTLYPFTPP